MALRGAAGLSGDTEYSRFCTSRGGVRWRAFLWCKREGCVEALVPGEYVLRETEAPEGYELAEDAPFTMEETADVQVVTMADEALPGTAPGTTPGGLPQTGDWSWLVPAACAAGAAVCVGGAIALGSRRRAKAGPTAREPMLRGGKRWRP